jgi:LacI family transcriptional regulator
MEVIQEYNFQPNHAARALASQRSRVIGILIPHVVSDLFSDPFFPTLLQGITHQANQLDYSVTLWLTGDTNDDEHFYQRALNSQISDGLLVVSAALDEVLMQRFNQSGKPFMLVGHPPPGYEAVNFVDTQNRDGAYQAVQYLIERGRKRIGIIPGRTGLSSSRDRLAGYQQALLDAGFPLDERLIAPSGNFTEAGGRESMRYLLSQDIDAVFCSSDIMAISAMRMIQQAGLRVPDDIAVAGFDDIPMAAVSGPPLTTVRQPIRLIGQAAAEGLIYVLENSLTEPYHRVLPAELIVRAST